ncbi:aspartate aminotransferase family protein [Candidatus Sumerlaeota bacterium]
MSYQEIEARHNSGFYGKRDLTIVRGAGCSVWDSEGNEYLDLIGGIAVASCGHANPRLAEAISRQAGTLMSCPEIFYNDQRAQFLERLNAVTPESMDRFFLCNSGTESVEAALKIARLATGRQEFVACNLAFHGRTMGALSATFKKDYREPFAPLVPGFSHVPFNNCEKLAAAVNERTAAVIIEPIQGEGGIRPADAEFLEQARELCDRHGCLLFFDEIQCGCGRTGRWWAHEHYGVVPDLMTMAKGLGGGFPLGVCGIGERVGELKKGAHGSTFGGNPLACAAGRAVIDFIEDEGLVARAAENGAYLNQQLGGIESPLVREVRGKGLMIAIELKKKSQPYIQKLQDEHRILTMIAGPTVIRMVPPLVIAQDEIDRAVEAVRTVLG